MRRVTVAVLAFVLALAIAGPISARGGPGSGAGNAFVPANATVQGHSLEDLAGAWGVWALGTPADVNPLINGRCEQSPFDKKVWFAPVSLGGDYAIDCALPAGAFLLVSPAGWFCDVAEAGGSTDAALEACVVNGFDLLTYVEASVDGRPPKNVDAYVVKTPRLELPGPNLLTEDPTSVMEKGYFLLVRPMSRGQHTIRLYAEFASLDFTAGITINVTVTTAPH